MEDKLKLGDYISMERCLEHDFYLSLLLNKNNKSYIWKNTTLQHINNYIFVLSYIDSASTYIKMDIIEESSFKNTKFTVVIPYRNAKIDTKRKRIRTINYFID